VHRFAIQLLAFVMLVYGCGSSGDDLIVFSDGGSKLGELEGCSAEICTLDGSPIPRTSILFIGLDGVAPPPPQVQDWREDEVHLVDATIHHGHVTSVDAEQVATVVQTFARDRVAWIYLAQALASGAAGSTGRAASEGGVVYRWRGRIEVENSYNGSNGRHRWKGEYAAEFLEVPTTSSSPGAQPGTSFRVSHFDPIGLQYAIDGDTAWDRGAFALQTGPLATGQPGSRVVSGDVRMLGRASGTLSAEQLEKGRVLVGDLYTLDAPQPTRIDIPTAFASDGERTDYYVDHVQRPSEAGWYQFSIGFLGYGNYRDRQPYSPEYYQDVRELYRGIDRTGQEPLRYPDPSHDFIHWLPACMPDGCTLFGRLESPYQSAVRGESTFPMEFGSGPSDAVRIAIRWQFARTREP
jgi:hypothetical protein